MVLKSLEANPIQVSTLPSKLVPKIALIGLNRLLGPRAPQCSLQCFNGAHFEINIDRAVDMTDTIVHSFAHVNASMGSLVHSTSGSTPFGCVQGVACKLPRIQTKITAETIALFISRLLDRFLPRVNKCYARNGLAKIHQNYKYKLI